MMRKIGAYGAIAALAAVVLSAPPAEAFGLRIGPFHIGLPFSLYRHHGRHPLYMRATPDDVARPQQTSPSAASAMLYPDLALSAIFQNVFLPAKTSPWPFGYQDIFSTAFARQPTNPDQRLCRQSGDTDAIIGRISTEVAPTADQMPHLQKLGGALAAASGSLAKSCPSEIPARPTARLKLMESQIEELAVAVDMIRQPLQEFEQSLNDEQKARFAAMIEAPASAADVAASACGGAPAAVDRSIDKISQSVQPTDVQRDALGDLKQSFNAANNDLAAHCPTAIAPTALGRLETTEARLDATYRAALSIQVSLATFETKLSDAQKDYFDQMNFAGR